MFVTEPRNSGTQGPRLGTWNSVYLARVRKSNNNKYLKKISISMASKGVVSWDRIYYTSVGLLVLAVLTGFFSKPVSFILWILLISLLTEIPGCVNHYLYEINMGEFFGVMLAIHFGGIKIGIICAIYVALLPLLSRMWKPDESIMGAIATFISFALVPVFYFYVYNQNLLLTLFTYTACMYITMFLMTLFIAPGKLFEGLRICMIALPLAYLTNLMYVGILEDWAMKMFKPTLQFPFYMKMILFALLLGIGGFVFIQRQGKK